MSRWDPGRDLFAQHGDVSGNGTRGNLLPGRR